MGKLRFFVNDRLVEEDAVPPTTTLLDYLRGTLRLTGTKEGCKEGDCGACTVEINEPDAAGGPTFRAVNACLVLLPMVQGKRVVTVEGLAKDGAPHPVQEALARHLGSQCGYCTPGVAMSLLEAGHRADLAEPWQLDDQLCGNLCRCTGYRPIRDAAAEVKGACRHDAHAAAAAAPAESPALDYRHGTARYRNPTTLDELFEALAEPGTRLVAGGTDLSLEITKRFEEPEKLVSVEAIPELRRLAPSGDGWSIGAAVTLSELQAQVGPELPALEKMLRFFASRQIKNRATVGGNLCNASPIGDLAPVLVALRARAVLASAKGERALPLEDFFVSYRKTALATGELLARIELPRPGEADRASSFKVSKRRELDISAVAAGCLVRIEGGTVTEARLCYGGMAATPKRAARAEAALAGRPWSRATVEAALSALAEDFAPLDDHRGSSWFRATVARNLLLGFYLETAASPAALDPRPTATVHLPKAVAK